MTRCKIVFFDIDGTLISTQTHKITENTLYTLSALRRQGVRICLATGRAPTELPKFDGVDFDAYLTFNASYCFDADDIIYSNPLMPQDVQTLIANAALLGRPVAVADPHGLAANGDDNADLKQYFDFGNTKLTVDPDFAARSRGEIFQVMLPCREDEYSAVLAGTQNAKIAAWWDRAVDVIPANGGKGIGIAAILAHYGIDKSEAVAFGDGSNDIEMFAAVGHAVAMGNAAKRVKDVADDVCGDVEEDGVYRYCVAQALIPEKQP